VDVSIHVFLCTSMTSDSHRYRFTARGNRPLVLGTGWVYPRITCFYRYSNSEPLSVTSVASRVIDAKHAKRVPNLVHTGAVG
jgi:hypothetical protein